MMDALFEYFYRDGANFKNHGSVVFRGDDLSIPDAIQRLKKVFDNDSDSFIASQIAIPEVFLWRPHKELQVEDGQLIAKIVDGYPVSENDHCWHEFDDLTPTTRKPTDPRTLTEFVVTVEKAAADGWQLWDVVNQ